MSSTPGNSDPSMDSGEQRRDPAVARPVRRVSVVVPVFRSRDSLGALHARLRDVLDRIAEDWEIILVDDASNDGTFERMLELRASDPRVKLVRFARNMGQQHATVHGIRRSTGDYVLTLDDDLQNPPESIPDFIRAIDAGHDIVIGRITGGKEHAVLRNLASRTVQRLAARILDKPRDLALSSFRCFSRRAADAIGAFRGAHPYLPALMLGSVPRDRICNVAVPHHPRAHGRSQYTARKLLKLVSYLLVNHSSVPLRAMVAWGMLVSVASLAYAAFVIVDVVANGSRIAGWPTLAVLVSFMSGNILMSLGVLGEYVGRLVAENAHGGVPAVFEEYL
jgi:glycosyltransferase involved in cell wall biosynthesis